MTDEQKKRDDMVAKLIERAYKANYVPPLYVLNAMARTPDERVSEEDLREYSRAR